MKNVFLIMGLLLGFAVSAQHPRQGKAPKQGMTPEQVATLQTKRMVLVLNLTDAQAQRLKTLHLEKAQYRQERIREMKAKKEAGTLERPTVEERYAMQNERLDRRIAEKRQLEKILDKDQLAKWDKIAENQKRKFHRKMENRSRHKGKHAHGR